MNSTRSKACSQCGGGGLIFPGDEPPVRRCGRCRGTGWEPAALPLLPAAKYIKPDGSKVVVAESADGIWLDVVQQDGTEP